MPDKLEDMIVPVNFSKWPTLNCTGSGGLCDYIGHDWQAQERGHKCSRCQMEEFIDPATKMKMVIDPTMPKDEIQMRDPVTGKILARLKV